MTCLASDSEILKGLLVYLMCILSWCLCLCCCMGWSPSPHLDSLVNLLSFSGRHRCTSVKHVRCHPSILIPSSFEGRGFSEILLHPLILGCPICHAYIFSHGTYCSALKFPNYVCLTECNRIL